MAFSGITVRGSNVDTASDNSLAMNPSAALAVGKLVIVQCVTTNEQTTDGESTGHSLADSQNNTWVKIAEYTETAGANNDGTANSIWYSIITTQIETTDTITLTTSANEAEKIICAIEVTFDNATNTIAIAQVGVGQNAIQASVSSLTSREYLLIGAGGARGSDNAKTPDADYTERFDLRNRNNAAAVTNHLVTRIATLTSDTCTSSAWTNTFPIFLLAALFEQSSIGFTGQPGSGPLSVGGQSPSVSATASVDAGVGALAITGQAPTFSAHWSDTPATASLVITGVAPTVTASVGNTVEIGAVQWLAEVEFSGDATLTPTTGSLVVTGQVPSVTASSATEPQTASLTITGFAPVVAANATLEPGVSALEITGEAPAFAAHHTAEPAVGSLAINGQAPTVSAASSVAPGTGALTLTGFAPDVGAEGAFTGTPDAGSLIVTGFAPAVTAQAAVTAGLGQVVVTGAAPTVAAASSAEPGPGGVVVAGFAPAVTATAAVTPAVGAVVITGQAPLAGSIFAADPSPGSISIAGHAPSLQTEHTLVLAAGGVVVTGFAPTFIAGQDILVQPGQGSLVVVGNPPSFAAHFEAANDPGVVRITGFVPSLQGEQVVAPPAGSIEIAGYPPFVSYLPPAGARIIPIGAADRQFAASGRRRVFRVPPRGGQQAA